MGIRQHMRIPGSRASEPGHFSPSFAHVDLLAKHRLYSRCLGHAEPLFGEPLGAAPAEGGPGGTLTLLVLGHTLGCEREDHASWGLSQAGGANGMRGFLR